MRVATLRMAEPCPTPGSSIFGTSSMAPADLPSCRAAHDDSRTTSERSSPQSARCRQRRSSRHTSDVAGARSAVPATEGFMPSSTPTPESAGSARAAKTMGSSRAGEARLGTCAESEFATEVEVALARRDCGGGDRAGAKSRLCEIEDPKRVVPSIGSEGSPTSGGSTCAASRELSISLCRASWL